MKKKIFTAILIILFLTACSNAATQITAPTSAEASIASPTPDLCTKENIPAQVEQFDKIMREFDDYSTLASSTPNSQLVNIIPDMQRIRRNAEDQQAPPCLINLRQLEIAHMNTVLQILLIFLSQPDPKKLNMNAINAGIAQARDLHSKYDIERARLLGVTLTPPPAPAVTPTP